MNGKIYPVKSSAIKQSLLTARNYSHKQWYAIISWTSKWLLLFKPRKTKFAEHAFSVSSPSVWNSLPADHPTQEWHCRF